MSEQLNTQPQTEVFSDMRAALGAMEPPAPLTPEPVAQQEPPEPQMPQAQDGDGNHVQQPDAPEEPKKEPEPQRDDMPFFKKVGNDFGTEFEDEASYRQWVEEMKKPKQAEWGSELAKAMHDFIGDAQDEAELKSRLHHFAWLHTTDFDGMAKTDSGIDHLLKLEYFMDNPGADADAAEFYVEQVRSQFNTDPESDDLLNKYGERAKNAAAFNKTELTKRVNGVINKLHEQRANLKPLAKPDGGKLMEEARQAYTKEAKAVLGSFKAGAEGVEYAMDEKTATDLANEKSYDTFMGSLFPEGRVSPKRIAELMAMEHFVKNAMPTFVKKARGNGVKEVIDKISNTEAPGLAKERGGGVTFFNSFADALGR